MQNNKNFDDEFIDEKEMSFSEHMEELRYRSIQSVVVFILATAFSLVNIKSLVKFLQSPAQGVKFLQLSPGEYIFTSIKISICFGLILSVPFILYQIMIFVLPGLTRKERNILLPTIAGSSILFLLGLLFGYIFIIPAALQFFLRYGADIIEPFWSFEEYFNFILLSLLTTGLAFQIPVLQIALGLLRILNSNQMLSIWRYIVTLSTVISAVLTPSTDPLTQVILAGVILILYFGGVVLLKFFGV